MKLLTRTILYFVAIALLVFSLGGFIFYHFLRSAASEDADERLNNERDKVITYVKTYHRIPLNVIFFGDTVCFTKVPESWNMNVLYKNMPASQDEKILTVATPEKGSHNDIELLKDTTLYNKSEKEVEPYRMLEFGLHEDTVSYRVMLLKPLIESDDLSGGILHSFLIIGGILLLLLVLLDIIIARREWKPFYASLEQLKSFDIIKGENIAFEKASTKEFKELNDVLANITTKMSSDYRSLKEFTENASHEIQTPLSVIQSKIELLIQSENLSATQLESVKAMYESVTRLSKLNLALLLLTKIENGQFTDIRDVDMQQLVESKLELFKERIEHKKLVVKNKSGPLSIKANPMLADVLVSNLIGNAIKHNVEGGKLEIEIKNKQMTISNSGNALTISPDHLFSRFKKANQASDSLGLGLAIVKEICNAYGFNIRYAYNTDNHKITVDF